MTTKKVKADKKTVTYGLIVVEPRNYLGASMDKVLARREKMLADFRKTTN